MQAPKLHVVGSDTKTQTGFGGNLSVGEAAAVGAISAVAAVYGTRVLDWAGAHTIAGIRKAWRWATTSKSPAADKAAEDVKSEKKKANA